MQDMHGSLDIRCDPADCCCWMHALSAQHLPTRQSIAIAKTPLPKQMYWYRQHSAPNIVYITRVQVHHLLEDAVLSAAYYKPVDGNLRHSKALHDGV